MNSIGKLFPDEEDQVPMAPAQPPAAPDVSTYIKQKYGIGDQYAKAAADHQAIDDAQQQRTRTNDIADWGQLISDTMGNHSHGVTDSMRNEANARVTGAQNAHKEQLANLLTTDELNQKDVTRGREAQDYSNKQDDRAHMLWRRPTEEGFADRSSEAGIGLKTAQTGETNAKAGEARATTAKTNYDLNNTKDLDKPDGAQAEALRKFIYSEVPELAKYGALDGASYNGIRNGPYKDIIDAKLKAKSGAANTTNQNNKFRTAYIKSEGAFNSADAKLGQTLNMVDQATKGGVASQLVPISIARDLAGRINIQELQAAGGDPSTMGKIARYLQKANDGSMTVQDANEYRDLITSQRASIAGARNKTREQDINSYAATNGMEPTDVRKMLAIEEAQAPAATPVAPVAAPVRMTSPDGKAYDVPADKVDAAKAKGWK